MAKKSTIQGTTFASEIDGFSSGYGLIDMISGVSNSKGTMLFPRATIVELYGLKSASKTTLLLSVIAYNQMINPDFKVLYADFEKMIRNQIPYLNSLGVQITEDKFKIIEPDTQEEGCAMMLDAVRNDDYDMIIVDTIAAMRPKVELEKGFAENKQMGVRAKNMSEFLRNLMADLPADGPAVIFINQEYKDIHSSSFVQTYTTPSSDALAFYAGIRIEVKELQKLKDKKINPYTLEEAEIPYGSIIRIKTLKNKVGTPFLESKYVITYGEGIDIVPSVINAAINAKVIRNKGASKSSFIFEVDGEEKSVVGMSKMIRYFKENPKALVSVGSAINELWAADLSHYEEMLSRKGTSNSSKFELYTVDDEAEEEVDEQELTSTGGTIDFNNLPESDEAPEATLDAAFKESKTHVKKVETSSTGGLKLTIN